MSSPVKRDFLKYILVPAALDYFKSSLKVKPRDRNITYPYDTCYNYKTPPKYQDVGVADADLLLLVNSVNEPESPFLAYAMACHIDGVTNR